MGFAIWGTDSRPNIKNMLRVKKCEESVLNNVKLRLKIFNILYSLLNIIFNQEVF